MKGSPTSGRAHSGISPICEGIRKKVLLEFDYHGHHRVVIGYCHGVSAAGKEVLRAVQIAGSSVSGAFGNGKLWLIEEMSNLHLTDTPCVPDDPNYNPNDRAIVRIHCRV